MTAVFALLFIALFLLIPRETLISPEQPDAEKYSISKALKVLRAIEKAEQEKEPNKGGKLREIELTEDELNSYIAFRIDVEQEEIMRELQLKFLEKNRIEGKIFVDLRGQNLPKILNPEMNIFFEGMLEIEEGKARLNLKKLFLENQSVQPAVLDLIIFIASKIEGTEPWSISDWFDLPYRIKDIKTHKGKAAFYY